MTYKIQIGSISHGTLRTGDLLETFACELDRYCDHFDLRAGSKTPTSEFRRVSGYLDLIKEAKCYGQLLELGHLNEDGEEHAASLIADLEDALNEIAPDYVHFGAHEGDGADFGYWPSIEALEEDARAGDVLKVSDTGDIPKGYSGLVMQVSDHGNVTLYSATPQDSTWHPHKLVELWSCV